MARKRVVNNVIMSVVQTAVIAINLVVLYRFLLTNVGVQYLGIWSLVMATTSLTRISELGITKSTTKYVAKYIARNEPIVVSRILETAVITIGLVFALLLGLLYYPAIVLLKYLIPSQEVEIALILLPYTFFSIWLNTIAGVYMSCMDGMQRMDVRAIVIIAGSVIYLAIALLSVPNYGLLGLALAQILQAIFVLVVSCILLKKLSKIQSIIPKVWDKELFNEMLFYGVNFQFASIMAILFDPFTKALLSKFGTLESVGYYEMSSRMVMQVRSLVVSANQAIVPFVATIVETDKSDIGRIYNDTYRLLTYGSAIIFGFLISMIPIISELWIGYFNDYFVLFSVILCIAWFINTLSGAAYFNNMGIGNLKWNTGAHTLMSTLNIILGLKLGEFYDELGVVIGAAISVVVGSSVLSISHSLYLKIPYILIPKEDILLLVSIVIAVFGEWCLYYKYFENQLNLTSAIGLAIGYFIFIVLPVWRHPKWAVITRLLSKAS